MKQRLLILLPLFLLVIPVFSQDLFVSDDEVNAIAEKMYCPVCENIPLDDCQTSTCIQWKEEIRQQLANGETEGEIISSFIARFGERVVGIPQDPVLQILTLVAPWLAPLIGLVIAFQLIRRWQSNQRLSQETVTPLEQRPPKSDDEYRTRLEADLEARR